MKPRLLTAIGLGIFASLATTTGQQAPADYVPGELILRFQSVTPPPRRDAVLAAQGVVQTRRFDAVNLVHARLAPGVATETAIAALQALPDVAHVSPNYLRAITAAAPPNDPFFVNGSLWGLNKIDAPAAWDTFGVGSSGVVVASIDTGVNYNHPDLAANMWQNPGEIPGNGIDDDTNGFIDDVHGINTITGSGDPMDNNGHGTHTAGTMAGVGDNGVGVVGVTWNTRILACKFLNSSGVGSDAGAIACLNYLIDMKSRGVNVRASNNSWGSARGTNPISTPLQEAFDAAGAAGILNVVAAGNLSKNIDAEPFDPASFDSPSIIAVAASNSSDTRPGFSNYGAAAVDLAAPGHDIDSTYNSGYNDLNGTSMAAPHVAGAAAFLVALQPAISVPALKSALLQSVDSLSYWSPLVGSGGRLNLYKAAQAASGNLPPDVTLTSPLAGATFDAPATIAVAADASDSDGSISQVEFFANGISLGVDTASPYAATWPGVGPGTYELTAVARDNLSAPRSSAPRSITVSSGGGSTSGGTNVALAASGGTAAASSTSGSGYPAAAVINGDRTGAPWGSGGAWRDGTSGSFPDWLEITFAGAASIDRVDVFSTQDAATSPVAPTPTMTTANGLRDFDVQYWTGTAWATVPNGAVRDNALVWRPVEFPALTTTKIRIWVLFGRANYSRVTEVEAWATEAPNEAPTVTLSNPPDGSEYVAPASLTVSATALDSDGTITGVEFFANGASLGVDGAAPYSVPWTNVAAGTYVLSAVATDDDGASTTSGTRSVTVTPDSPPPPGGTNVALAANGGTAAASSTSGSGYPAAAVINGDRTGAPWGSGGAWRDGTSGSFPDWLEITFAGAASIDRVDVFSTQDAATSPVAPTPTMTTANGLRDFDVQYWTGTAWATVPNGAVRNNALVWRPVEFPALTTTKIRIWVLFGRANYSRVTEVEAWTAGAPPPLATTWYVAPGGAGTGLPTDPFGRLQDALAVAEPGHVVLVQPGTYTGAFQSVRAGTAAAPITVRTTGPRGSAVVTASGRVLTVSHPFFVVDGLVLDGQYGADDAVRISSAADDLVLRNIEVRRSSRDLIDMAGPERVLIDGALIHHALNAAGGRTDAHGIAAGPVRDLTIRNTEIHTFSGDGIQVDPGRDAPGWNNVVVEGTRIWLAPLPAPENGFPTGAVAGENGIDTKADGTLPRATLVIRDVVVSGFRAGMIANMAAFNLKEHVDVTVDGVTVFDSNIAFRMRGPGSSTIGAHVTVMNVVAYDTSTVFRYEDDIQQLRIWNATIGTGVTRAFLAASSSSSGLEVRNLLFQGSRPSEASHASNLSASTTWFVDAGAHDYRLASGAGAIDAGVALPAVTQDRAGVARPRGAGYDVGAYER